MGEGAGAGEQHSESSSRFEEYVQLVEKFIVGAKAFMSGYEELDSDDDDLASTARKLGWSGTVDAYGDAMDDAYENDDVLSEEDDVDILCEDDELLLAET